MKPRLLPATLVLIAACGQQAATPPGSPAPYPDAPPWSSGLLAPSEVPAVLVQEWEQAENRATCAPIAFTDLGVGSNATPRAATFSGGWSVAYDQPNLRSAFGIAGTGVKAADPSYDEWPVKREWGDGSSVGYGPEGGTGPKELAYLRIAGQECLYNVWSHLGRAHLETLLNSIRFVDVD